MQPKRVARCSSAAEQRGEGGSLFPPPRSNSGVVSDGAFPKEARLRTRRDFLRVQNAGTRLVTSEFIVLVLTRPEPDTRLGITVTKKIGGAVVRVRLRRRIREIFRKARHKLPPRLDLVLIAKSHAKETTHQQLERAFDVIATRLRDLFPCES